MPARTVAALLCLSACLLVGCGRRSIADDPWTLDVAGPVAIDVQVFAGDVRVSADPRLTQAVVRVRRESTLTTQTAEEAEQAMGEMGYSVDVVPGQIGQVIEVRGSTRESEQAFQRLNVEIDVPIAEGVTVRTSRGRVIVRNVQGALNIRTTERDVQVVTDRPLVEPVTLITQYGDIDMRCRGESRGELDFQAPGGRVFQKIRFGKTIVHPGTKQDALMATFNAGTNPVVLRTVDGDIRFVVESNPAAFGQWVIP